MPGGVLLGDLRTVFVVQALREGNTWPGPVGGSDMALDSYILVRLEAVQRDHSGASPCTFSRPRSENIGKSSTRLEHKTKRIHSPPHRKF